MPISTSKEIVLEKLSVPQEGILHREDNVTCFNKNTNVGSGRLYVTERSILWLNGDDFGFFLDYQKMNMHAISRNINSFPHPCIYIMLESDTNDEDKVDNDDDDDDEDDDDIREIRFAPTNATSLDEIYNAMSRGNELNPDPNDSNSGDENDEEYEGDEGQGDGGHDLITNGNGVSTNECEDAAPEEGQFDDDDDMQS